MKKFYLLLAFLVLMLGTEETTLAQTPGKDGSRAVFSVDTTVNLSTTLANNVAIGATQIRVGSYAGFAANDFIMIYQAQGATISQVNDSTYGAVTALNNAGYYEFRNVVSTSGSNRINISPALTHSYTASGNVQVLRVPQYSSLYIAPGASIAPRAWNGTTGGVVAIHVQNTATINGSIHANSRGFRGGVLDNQSNSTLPNANLSYRSTDANDGEQKGESIAGLASALTSGQYGRGAPANGGGGGNSHNAGGGGGANGNNGNTWSGHGVMSNSVTGSSAWQLDGGWFVHGGALANSSGGGRGGYTYSANDLDALASGPGIASWGGDYRQERGGRGGHPLDNDASNRIFLGGGGGAGDGNNSCGGAGGPGGGIVFLMAATVTGTGNIRSNGGNGANTTGNGNDAPGGGGGGGSVIAWVTSSFNGVSLAATGGNGGNQSITWTETEGPGGGGGGGFIAYPASASPTLSVNGGTGGTSNGPSLVEFPRNGATDGAPGNTAVITWIPLPVELVSFSGEMTGNTVALRWRTVTETNNYGFDVERSVDNARWDKIGFVDGNGTSNTPHVYGFSDPAPEAASVLYYRLRQIDRDGKATVSPVVQVTPLLSRGTAFTSLYPQPATDVLAIGFSLAEPGAVRISIINALGAEVAVPFSGGMLPAGSHAIPAGVAGLPRGAYLCRIETGAGVASKVFVIAR
ncbi:MAG: T9SS type A sorting domain-containing protein [Ignavibacteria bacterium]|nr:T9SS type A sorting domain-containing protein [Ignavibacteria bacterium]